MTWCVIVINFDIHVPSMLLCSARASHASQTWKDNRGGVNAIVKAPPAPPPLPLPTAPVPQPRTEKSVSCWMGGVGEHNMKLFFKFYIIWFLKGCTCFVEKNGISVVFCCRNVGLPEI